MIKLIPILLTLSGCVSISSTDVVIIEVSEPRISASVCGNIKE